MQKCGYPCIGTMLLCFSFLSYDVAYGFSSCDRMEEELKSAGQYTLEQARQYCTNECKRKIEFHEYRENIKSASEEHGYKLLSSDDFMLDAKAYEGQKVALLGQYVKLGNRETLTNSVRDPDTLAIGPLAGIVHHGIDLFTENVTRDLRQAL